MELSGILTVQAVYLLMKVNFLDILINNLPNTVISIGTRKERLFFVIRGLRGKYPLTWS